MIIIFWIIFNSSIAVIISITAVIIIQVQYRLSPLKNKTCVRLPDDPNSLNAEKQVPYFAITGTLLGAMRCGQQDKGSGDFFFKCL